MSAETLNWLNENVLVGFTAKRGNAWHWRKASDNHYPGAIPVEIVRRRLFDWEPIKVETYYYRNHQHLPTGEYIYTRSSDGRKLCATTGTHKAHGFSEWLIQNVSNVMDDSVQIGSAGLLRGGNVAWVQIEFPETFQAEGVAFRPTILASTSIDGSLASTYKAVNTIVVCDNTLSMAMRESAEAYRVRHTKHSKFRVIDAREKLGVQLAAQAEAAEAEISRLVNREVTSRQFARFLDVVNPIPIEEGRGRTMAENKRDKLTEMWNYDPRVTVWKNTLWGVLQLMNTYETHERKFQGIRAESTITATVSGKAFQKDAETRAEIERILADA